MITTRVWDMVWLRIQIGRNDIITFYITHEKLSEIDSNSDIFEKSLICREGPLLRFDSSGFHNLILERCLRVLFMN